MGLGKEVVASGGSLDLRKSRTPLVILCCYPTWLSLVSSAGWNLLSSQQHHISSQLSSGRHEAPFPKQGDIWFCRNVPCALCRRMWSGGHKADIKNSLNPSSQMHLHGAPAAQDKVFSAAPPWLGAPPFSACASKTISIFQPKSPSVFFLFS